MQVAVTMGVKKVVVFKVIFHLPKAFPHSYIVSHNLSLYMHLYEDQLSLPLLCIYVHIVTFYSSIYI